MKYTTDWKQKHGIVLNDMHNKLEEAARDHQGEDIEGRNDGLY